GGGVAARLREAGRRGAVGLVRRGVLLPVGPVEEGGPADEEGEVRVRPPPDGEPVAPHAPAARAVERHDHELRRPRRRRRRPPPRVRREQRAGDRQQGQEPHAPIVGRRRSGAVQVGFTEGGTAVHDRRVNYLGGLTVLGSRRVSAVLCSTDLERSQAFYEQQVGLSLSPETIKNHLLFECGDGSTLLVY